MENNSEVIKKSITECLKEYWRAYDEIENERKKNVKKYCVQAG